jgi:hypothetical protein
MKFNDIIERCGGEIDLSYKLRATQFAIAQWKTRGIPERYWGQITKLAKCTVEDLHKLNEELRQKRK